MINKCPSCGKTAIGPIEKMFLFGFPPVFNCKECGTKLKLPYWKIVKINVLFFIPFWGAVIRLPRLDIAKHRFFSTYWFIAGFFIIWVVGYIFSYTRFVPLVKSSK